MNRAEHIDRWAELVGATIIVDLGALVAVSSVSFDESPPDLVQISLMCFVLSLPISWTTIAFFRYRSVGQRVFTTVMIIFSGTYAFGALDLWWEHFRRFF